MGLKATNPRWRTRGPKFPVTRRQAVSPAVLQKALEIADGDPRQITVINYSKVEVRPK